ncbi:YdbL family protein [Sneathiella sp.]|uniref:YdbL family protein n=1 Tax=Sneathiella sp. TaxID=1964365 RepID=UPI0035632364
MVTERKDRNFSRRFVLGGVLAIAVLGSGLASFPAWAGELEDLRASGAIGEAYDGFARARDSSAKSFVDNLNAQRREIYTKRAAAQGVPVDQVGRVYASQILQKAPAGTWVLAENGTWKQK